MASLQNIINFYRECYLSDYKAISVDNFFAKQVSNQFMLTSFEAISESITSYPIDSEYGKNLAEELAIFSKEKGLYVAAFFIKGKSKLLGRPIRIFAPLYLYEAILKVEGEVYLLEVDKSQPIINPAFLTFMKSVDDQVNFSYDELVDQLPLGAMDFENLIALQSSLKKLFPKLNISGIEERMESDHYGFDLEKIYKSRSDITHMTLIAGAVIGMINKPKGARGVINELKELAERKIDSILLEKFFVEKEAEDIPLVSRAINIPVALSERQKEVFYAADSQTITQVIGPPGTGKSFTIAALTTELISQGKSVLIASKNNQAGKVIAHKIENEFGLKGMVVKTATENYKRSLVARVSKILWGTSRSVVSKKNLIQQLMGIEALHENLERLRKKLLFRESEEIEWGRFFHQNKNGFFQRFKEKWIRYKHGSRESIWSLKNEIDIDEKIKNRKIKRFIKDRYNAYLHSYLSANRTQFSNLLKALKQETGNLIHEHFDLINFNLVLKAMPAWICNTSALHNILPFQENLFDVLIIDEASQCDIASTIPLLYRAKKVVVVGDPNQLRHISFLSHHQQQALKLKYKLEENVLDYRDNSILDLANKVIQRQAQVIFLDEHYRSVPSIIKFSNHKFYGDNLKIMTVNPSVQVDQGLVVHKLKGNRNEKGYNEIEANAIVEKVKEIVERDKEISGKICESIGIISPFRSQIDFLRKLIRKSLDINALRKHRILIGTPYHFQGEERDMVLLSFVVDHEVHPSIYTYLNREDMFNVSITRARNKQLIYTSVDFQKLNANYLLTQYLGSVGQDTDDVFANEEDIHDQFAEEVIEVLDNLDTQKIYKYYAVGGIEIDLVVVKNNKTYCIDLIGYPGEFTSQFSLEKMQLLDRIGFGIFFLPYSNWYLDREKCVLQLIRYLGGV